MPDDYKQPVLSPEGRAAIGLPPVGDWGAPLGTQPGLPTVNMGSPIAQPQGVDVKSDSVTVVQPPAIIATMASVKNLSKAGFTARREARKGSPFEVAKPGDSQRWKILLWGPSGTLKTRTVLQFPSPVVIDLERGTDRYRDEFKFSVLPPSTPDEILQAVRWLRDNEHQYKTLIIDPITVYWAELQRKWSDIFLVRLQGRKTHHTEFFELGPREWATIKAEFAELLRTCLQCDMNIIFVAHDKAQYESSGGDIMRKVGEMPDAEKNLVRVFDVVVRCEQVLEPKGKKFYGSVVKDRTAKLAKGDPLGRFELSYPAFVEALGIGSVNRKAAPRQAPTEEQLAKIDVAVKAIGLNEAQVYDRLQTYGVAQFADLSRVQAQAIVEKLEAALAKKEEK